MTYFCHFHQYSVFNYSKQRNIRSSSYNCLSSWQISFQKAITLLEYENVNVGQNPLNAKYRINIEKSCHWRSRWCNPVRALAHRGQRLEDRPWSPSCLALRAGKGLTVMICIVRMVKRARRIFCSGRGCSAASYTVNSSRGNVEFVLNCSSPLKNHT
jgi:hypothetical protein